MAEVNKRDGVFTGETRTVTNPSPDGISGHAGPHGRPAPTQYGKLPGRGGLSSNRPAPALEDDVNRPEAADDVNLPVAAKSY